MFLLGSHDARTFVPNYPFEELKDLPSDQLPAGSNAHQVLNGSYTRLGSIPPLAGAAMRELFMKVSGTIATLQGEIDYAVNEGLGNCSDWTSVVIRKKLIRIVALSGGRVLVGRRLSRDEELPTRLMCHTMCLATTDSSGPLSHPSSSPSTGPLSSCSCQKA